MSALKSVPKEHSLRAGPPRAEDAMRYLPVAVLLVVVVLLASFVPNFFTARNIVNILMQASALGLMAIGLTAVLIGGGMDLSIPSVMAMSAVFGAIAMRDGAHPLVGCLVMVATASVAGCINGYAVAYLKMIPFVVTLAMMTIATGTSIWITNSISVAGIPAAFTDTILTRIWIVPLPVIFLALVTLAVSFLIRRTVFGRWLYAVGTNERTARVSGIPTARVLFGTYLFSSFFAGLAAILLTARLNSAAATMGNDGVVLDVVSSAVVGGVSIYGGIGSPLGAVLGAIIITMISNSMNMMQVSFFTSLIVKGIVIIAFVALDSLRRR
jgi:ribose transport system permease protein